MSAARGETSTVLAARYGINPGTCCRILRGDAWKHVPAANDATKKAEGE